MIAVDTNVLVRWLTRDDPAQAARADKIMAAPVLISSTMSLALAWALGGKTFRFDRATLAATLSGVVDLAKATIAQEADVRWAIERLAAGADVADMLRIVAARGASGFLSFKHDLARLAGPDTPLPIELA